MLDKIMSALFRATVYSVLKQESFLIVLIETCLLEVLFFLSATFIVEVDRIITKVKFGIKTYLKLFLNKIQNPNGFIKTQQKEIRSKRKYYRGRLFWLCDCVLCQKGKSRKCQNRPQECYKCSYPRVRD